MTLRLNIVNREKGKVESTIWSLGVVIPSPRFRCVYCIFFH